MVIFIFIPIGFDECEVEWVASNTQAALISGFPMAKAIVCDLFLSGEGVANNHGTSGFHGDLSCNNSLTSIPLTKSGRVFDLWLLRRVAVGAGDWQREREARTPVYAHRTHNGGYWLLV